MKHMYLKKLIFLKVEDPNPSDKKIKAADLLKLEQKALISTVKLFKEQVKKLKEIKILEEIADKPQIIIEFPEEQRYAVQDLLYSLDCVEIIDSFLPLTQDEIKAKNKATQKLEENFSHHDEVKKLKAKMEKYKK